MWRALIVAVVLGLAACSSGGDPSTPASPSSAPPPRSAPSPTVAVAGSISLTDPYGYTHGQHYAVDSACHGIRGYDDITRAADVVVATDSGRTLVITHLHAGRIDGRQNCTFAFRARVPAGLGFYEVTVSSRGTIKERESQLGDIALKLG